MQKKVFLASEYNSYNSMMQCFLDIVKHINKEQLWSDLRTIDTIKLNFKKSFIPFLNRNEVKKTKEKWTDKFNSDLIADLFFYDYFKVIWKYNITLIFILLIIVIPISCVWSLLPNDMQPIAIAISVIAPITSLGLFVMAFYFLKYYYKGWKNSSSNSIVYYYGIKKIISFKYLINFKYFYKQENLGIGIEAPDRIILKLENGSTYYFDNFESLCDQLKTMDKNLLFLKEDVIFSKKKLRFEVNVYKFPKEYRLELVNIITSKDQDQNNLVVFSNEPFDKFGQI